MSVKQFIQSLKYAGAGFWYVLRTQQNMRVHFAFFLVAMAVNTWLQLTAIEWAIILLTIALVWIAEMLNTVLEITLDLITREWNRYVKHAKDVSAGLVLVTAAFSVMVGLCIWGPKLMGKLLGS